LKAIFYKGESKVRGGVPDLPSDDLSSIRHPCSPKVTVANFSFGNSRSMDIRALGIDGASVQACGT